MEIFCNWNDLMWITQSLLENTQYLDFLSTNKWLYNDVKIIDNFKKGYNLKKNENLNSHTSLIRKMHGHWGRLQRVPFFTSPSGPPFVTFLFSVLQLHLGSTLISLANACRWSKASTNLKEAYTLGFSLVPAPLPSDQAHASLLEDERHVEHSWVPIIMVEVIRDQLPARQPQMWEQGQPRSAELSSQHPTNLPPPETWAVNTYWSFCGVLFGRQLWEKIRKKGK